jgi:serpin B
MPANVEKAAAGHFEEIRRVAMAYAALQKQLSGTGAERKFQLFVANALWGQKGIPFKPAFLATVKDSFGGGLNDVDFKGATEAARKTINDWVAAQTKDKIKDLIGENILSPDTVLVLTNAIYFKAAWMQPFREQLTKKAPFYLSADAKVDADMMNLWHEFDYAEAGGAKLLLLPYEGSELSMLVILPDKREGVAEVEKSLTVENLKAWTAKLKGENVHVSLPRFKTTISFDLGEKLQALGMKRAFNSKEADFSGMTSATPLFISKVLHKAFVDVNEAGTEAAAATAVVMTKGAAPAKVVEFVADHPFLFLIRENATGCILFMGRVVDPTK